MEGNCAPPETEVDGLSVPLHREVLPAKHGFLVKFVGVTNRPSYSNTRVVAVTKRCTRELHNLVFV